MLNRLSILHVIAPGDAGGLESVVRLLAIGQRYRGHAVCVAAILDLEVDGCQPYLSSLEDAGVEVIRLPIPPRAYLRERASVGEVCSRYRPSIVHTHGYRPDVLHGDVARRLGVPTVTTVHGFCGGGLKNRFYERVQRVAFRRFDAVVAVCRPLAESLIASGVRRSQIHIVPNAYTSTPTLDRRTARQQLSIPEDEFVLGWVGRLSREKGADVFVDALARLVDLPVTASVLGDGPERERLRARATARGIGDRIRWHGVVPEAGSFFHAFDAFVLTSRTEGCPMVLFEAMAVRVPIVATEVGGVPDVVSPAEGTLVAPDNPGALAEAIRGVHRNQARAALRADAARDRLLSDFQLQPWLDRYQTIYTQLHARPAAAAV
jgi:glycosyltransferase involved in cell wall biosynthesis